MPVRHLSPRRSPSPEPRIVVVGDCLLDVTVRARVPVRGGDRPAKIHVAPGGQAANVAVRLARRGRRVRLVAPLGADLAGNLLASALAGEGVELDPLPAERTGAVLVLVEPDGERAMLSDRVPPIASGAALTEALRPRLAGAGWIHVSGYALGDPSSGRTLAGLIGETQVRLSADAGSVRGRDGAADRMVEILRQARPRIVFAGQEEAEALAARPAAAVDPDAAPAEARAGLAELAAAVAERLEIEIVIVTGGGIGSAAAVAGRQTRVAVPAARLRRVADTTGAGDAYAAAVIAELADLERWPPPVDALRRAMRAGTALAGQVVRVSGAQARVAGEAGAVAGIPR